MDLGRLFMALLQSAPTATTIILRTLVRRMASTAQSISRAVSLSALAPGSAVAGVEDSVVTGTSVADETSADSAATAISAVAVIFVATVASGAAQQSTRGLASVGATPFMAAVIRSTAEAVADSMVVPIRSMAEAVADHMVVAARAAVAVHMAAAVGN